MELIEKATLLALRAHEGQKRKEADIPYIVHPIRVALILAHHNFSNEVIAAGLVHDTVEDTSVSFTDIVKELGEDVAALVVPLTHDDSLSWEEKKKAYIASVRTASDATKAISVADKIANAESFLSAYEKQGREMWKHFNAGRDKKLWFERAMLTMLEETWEHPLVDEYKALVETLETLD